MFFFVARNVKTFYRSEHEDTSKEDKKDNGDFYSTFLQSVSVLGVLQKNSLFQGQTDGTGFPGLQ